MIEIMPSGERRRKLRFSPSLSPSEKKERMEKLKEAEESEEEENIKVAETLIDELEYMGIKCERCGSKNVKVEEETDSYSVLKCLDCNYQWKDMK